MNTVVTENVIRSSRTVNKTRLCTPTLFNFEGQSTWNRSIDFYYTQISGLKRNPITVQKITKYHNSHSVMLTTTNCNSLFLESFHSNHVPQTVLWSNCVCVKTFIFSLFFASLCKHCSLQVKMLVNNESDVPSFFRKALAVSILESVIYVLLHVPT